MKNKMEVVGRGIFKKPMWSSRGTSLIDSSLKRISLHTYIVVQGGAEQAQMQMRKTNLYKQLSENRGTL